MMRHPRTQGWIYRWRLRARSPGWRLACHWATRPKRRCPPPIPGEPLSPNRALHPSRLQPLPRHISSAGAQWVRAASQILKLVNMKSSRNSLLQLWLMPGKPDRHRLCHFNIFVALEAEEKQHNQRKHFSPEGQGPVKPIEIANGFQF